MTLAEGLMTGDVQLRLKPERKLLEDNGWTFLRTKRTEGSSVVTNPWTKSNCDGSGCPRFRTWPRCC